MDKVSFEEFCNQGRNLVVYFHNHFPKNEESFVQIDTGDLVVIEAETNDNYYRVIYKIFNEEDQYCLDLDRKSGQLRTYFYKGE